MKTKVEPANGDLVGPGSVREPRTPCTKIGVVSADRPLDEYSHPSHFEPEPADKWTDVQNPESGLSSPHILETPAWEPVKPDSRIDEHLRKLVVKFGKPEHITVFEMPYLDGAQVSEAIGLLNSYASGVKFIPASAPDLADPVAEDTRSLPEKVSAAQERGARLYGNTDQTGANYGLILTAMIQQHYGIVLDHPVPGWLALAINAEIKNVRFSRPGYREDDGVDFVSYLQLADAAKRRNEEVVE